MTPFSHFQYRCISCNHELTTLLPACENCGPGATGIFSIDKDTQKVQLVCQKCFQPQHTGNSIPSNCPTCMTGYCDWWDNEKNSWLNLDLEPNLLNENEFWVMGDFDGDYEAELAPQFKKGNSNPTIQSLFHVVVKHSYLKNVRIINEPPLTVSANDKRPFTFPLIAPVDIEVNRPDSPSSINRAALKDFRLHNWTLVATLTSSDHGSNKRFGRIKGTAYGILTEHVEKPAEPIIKKTFWQKKSSTPSLENTALTSEHLSQEDDVVTKDETSYNHEIKADECISCNLFLQLIAFLLIWLGCNLRTALLYAILVSASCLISKKLISKNMTLKKPWIRKVSSAAILACALGSLTIGYWPSFISNCSTLSQYAVLACVITLLLSVLVRYCFVRVITFLCLVIALTSWCKINNRECRFSEPTNLVVTAAQSLYQQFQILTDNDVSSEILNDSSMFNPNGRYLSINEAASNPNLLKDCKNKIYIPISFNKDQLDESTKIKLDRLGEIMQNFQGSRVIISGYSAFETGDKTPEGNLQNIAISQKRTEVIRDYLANNNYIDSTNIEIRAYGSNVPILKNKPSSKLNRRVEVNLQCSQP